MIEVEKKVILLAEDDASMRRFIEIILQKADYRVLTAEDGLEAIQIALETKIDAVVADAIMPNLTGFDLCRMVNQDRPQGKIPCVILSGLENSNSANSSEGIADFFLTKDANLKVNLIETLKKML